MAINGAIGEHGSWFETTEYHERVQRIREELARRDLDALLAFLPESITYLTGYHTLGYSTSFQFLIVPTEGDPTIVARSVEQYWIDQMSVYPGRFWWFDGEPKGSVVVRAVRALLPPRARLGIELGAWTLNALLYRELSDELREYHFEGDAGMIDRMRLVKSPAELDYMRKASRAVECGMAAAIDAVSSSATEREVAAAASAALILNGSDTDIVGSLASGPAAYHIHGEYGDRAIRSGDLVFIEINGNVHHYNSRFMRPVRLGTAHDDEVRLAERLIAIQDRAILAVAPGVSATVPDGIYRDGILGTGAVDRYTNKTFYSLGFMLWPNSYEPLEATPGADWTFEVGMTFHTYLIVNGLCFSEIVAVTANGVEILTRFPRQLFVKP